MFISQVSLQLSQLSKNSMNTLTVLHKSTEIVVVCYFILILSSSDISDTGPGGVIRCVQTSAK